MPGQPDYLNDFYNAKDEDARLTTRQGMVEYRTTLHYIEKYLRPGMRVLEIGAGTGRYSLELARRGCCVRAVELIDRNIQVFREKIRPDMDIEVYQGNALDLSFLQDASFDMVLLLGPMYHLYTRQDQQQALSEAMRLTRPGGYLYTAYCLMDASILSFGFLKDGGKNAQMLIDKGLLDPVTFEASSSPAEIFQLYRREHIDQLASRLPAARLHYVAADLAANYIREALAAMDEETFELYMRYHLAICERGDLAGASHHILDIHQKNL